MNALVREKIQEFLSEDIPETLQRELSLGAIQPPCKGNIVNLVVGVRRCGKTYRLYQEMHRILKAGYAKSSMLYFNFEDERLKPYDSSLLSDVVDSFYAMQPHAKQEGAFFFFDEIQVVPEWGTFLRRMVDTQGATIYVTGSSSKMLSSDLASAFRGRSLAREMFPLSFSEFITFEKAKHPGKGLYPSSTVYPSSLEPLAKDNPVFTGGEKAILRNALERYLLRGGFPAVQNLEMSESIMMLQDYANRTIAYDVIERYNLTNPIVASSFLSRCLASSGRELSINKAYNTLKSQGTSVSRNTLAQLLTYFEDAYLLFSVQEFTRELSDNPRSATKVYVVDQGMFSAFSPSISNDEGQRLETAVFAQLRRTAPSSRRGVVSRLKADNSFAKYEVDFIVGDALMQSAYQLIQVSCSLADEAAAKREIRALEAAMERYGTAESWIVTLDEEREISTAQGTIHVVPAWRWLLS